MKANASSRIRSTRRKRGAAVLEDVLAIAAVMGCFVVPIAVAARTAGVRLAGEMNHAHHVLLHQTQP